MRLPQMLVEMMVMHGDYAAAEKACKIFKCPEDVRQFVVRTCLDIGRVKDARRMAEGWGLKELYGEAQARSRVRPKRKQNRTG